MRTRNNYYGVCVACFEYEYLHQFTQDGETLDLCAACFEWKDFWSNPAEQEIGIRA